MKLKNINSFKQFVNENLTSNYEQYKELLTFAPKEQRFDIVKRTIQLLGSEKLDKFNIRELLNFTPAERQHEIVDILFPLVKDNLNSSIVGSLLGCTKEEQRYDFFMNDIFPLIKDSGFDYYMLSSIINSMPVDKVNKVVQFLFPLINKEELSDERIVSVLLSFGQKDEELFKIGKQIFPFVQDKLLADVKNDNHQGMINILRRGFPQDSPEYKKLNNLARYGSFEKDNLSNKFKNFFK